MARKRKGRPIHGWLLIDKPVGLSSTAVVTKVRRALNAQKAGHAGTLDPLATGLLAVALGEATKTIPYVTDALKAYRFAVTLGAQTTTDDAEGEVCLKSDERPTDQDIKTALVGLRGEILQTPPLFSAVKVSGARAYDLARAGETLELSARPIWVEKLEVLTRLSPDRVELEMVCGKGGYVRSVARDLGQSLGCYGHVAWLRRIWSGAFDVQDALSINQLDDFADADVLEASLLPLEAGLDSIPELPTTETEAMRMRNGNPGQVLRGDVDDGTEAWASFKGHAIALGDYRAGLLHPRKVFQTYHTL